ncbi:site-specific DNA-methyltransferase [Acinetobacter sp. RF15A]|uniref:site-specific DNA-methyltransferase n=1 Tax=unclassified Acinetobacter TaxID=196816 RepID=UPI001169C278|nr:MULTISPECIES: site-specific DNA-methyltransferase [unclassified Acinetobacter]TQR71202.1 site-specific DNA-methyltransferase [Acinetobacter sp. RF14B]TSH75878.1 site-specific DNA-methyltransferase [Acinetobacter sp. RF15A]TSI17517.1 site-specific DNA-methyltransferase [Acinetobacter sp. RF15B]
MSDQLKMHSPNLVDANIEKISALFPNCITETKDENGELKKAVDFDLLKQELSQVLVEGEQERYHLDWVGKKEAILTANAPIAKTLRPCREESVNFDKTENLFIEGDNLEALKLLQENYLGKVKMIYIDPPYNTGNDFIYKDNFAINRDLYKLQANEIDQEGNKFFTNSDSNGRFHSDWLSDIYPKLRLSKNLLADDGFIIVSIGERELSNMLKMLSEVFGEKNQLGIFTWKSRSKPTNAGNSKYRAQKVAEYVIVYSMTNPEEVILNLSSSKSRTYPHTDTDGRKYRTTTILTSNRGSFRRETMRFESNGYLPEEEYRWKAGKETIENLFADNQIIFNEDGYPVLKKYEDDEYDPLYPVYTYLDTDLTGTAENGKSELNFLVGNQHGFDTVKPINLMKYLIQTFSNEGDLILDLYAGSGTTAQAIVEINKEIDSNNERKFILIQIAHEGIENIFHKRILGLKNKYNLTCGYRFLKIDSTNMKDVYYTPDALRQADMLDLASNIKEDRTSEDLLFQVMLDWGLELSLPIERKTIAGKEVFYVAGNSLVACFDDLTFDVVDEVAKDRPLRFVSAEKAIRLDHDKTNIKERFKQLSPDTEVKFL